VARGGGDGRAGAIVVPLSTRFGSGIIRVSVAVIAMASQNGRSLCRPDFLKRDGRGSRHNGCCSRHDGCRWGGQGRGSGSNRCGGQSGQWPGNPKDAGRGVPRAVSSVGSRGASSAGGGGMDSLAKDTADSSGPRNPNDASRGTPKASMGSEGALKALSSAGGRGAPEAASSAGSSAGPFITRWPKIVLSTLYHWPMGCRFLMLYHPQICWWEFQGGGDCIGGAGL
jgi:hypothetical protein